MEEGEDGKVLIMEKDGEWLKVYLEGLVEEGY